MIHRDFFTETKLCRPDSTLCKCKEKMAKQNKLNSTKDIYIVALFKYIFMLINITENITYLEMRFKMWSSCIVKVFVCYVLHNHRENTDLTVVQQTLNPEGQ